MTTPTPRSRPSCCRSVTSDDVGRALLAVYFDPLYAQTGEPVDCAFQQIETGKYGVRDKRHEGIQFQVPRGYGKAYHLFEPERRHTGLDCHFRDDRVYLAGHEG